MILAGGGTISLCNAGHGTVAEPEPTPYHAIPSANVFRLAQPVPAPVVAQTAPLPRFRLAGITTFPRGKRALLQVASTPLRDRNSEEQSFILEEGQRSGKVEILAIDEIAGSVRLSYAGTPVVLTLANDAPTPKAGPPTPPPLPPEINLPHPPPRQRPAPQVLPTDQGGT